MKISKNVQVSRFFKFMTGDFSIFKEYLITTISPI